MRALVVHPPSPGVELLEVPEPTAGPGELKVRLLECGVCGTDREIVAGAYGTPPPGRADLILGHENLGEISVVGEEVTGFAPGDLVVATVRRGCGACRFCLANRSDFCETGRFTERGIRGRDGYFAESYVDTPEYLVRLPELLRGSAVLLEPLSIVEKAVAEGRRVLSRRGDTPGFSPAAPPRALVAGTGAVGLLAAFLLRSEGYEVTAIDRHGEDTPAAALLHRVGATHGDAAGGLGALRVGRFELVIEATGNAPLDFELLRALGPNGVLVLTGLPSAPGSTLPVEAGSLLRDLVLGNQAIVGSVNANRRFFERGVAHLTRFGQLWGDAVERIVSERWPMEQFPERAATPTEAGTKTVLSIPAG